MKRIVILFFIALFLNSCVSYNRITSPKTLNKDEHQFNFGLTANPGVLIQSSSAIDTDLESSLYGLQPVLGYRFGIAENNELGIRIHGLFYPQLALDWKHVFYNKEDFYFSGDFSVYGGYSRSSSIQYDLLFGKESFYGTIGAYYPIIYSYPGLHVGVGSMNIGNSGLGIQINYSYMFADYSTQWHDVLFGVTLNLNRIKKKYRD